MHLDDWPDGIAGTRIVVVNPVREPGLERYWVPSIPMSALFGTKIHVLSRDPGRDEGRLRDVLARSGIAVEAVRTRMLSLEDVFVSRVMALEQAAQKEVSA